jgi:hypothetical protein
MTIVCPKCMNKAADEERVCPRCGTILLSAKQRQELIRRSSNGENEAATAPPRRRSAARAGTEDQAGTTGLATSVNPADALREALEAIESLGDSPPPRRRVYQSKADQPKRKVTRGWAVTIAVSAVVALGVGLFFGLQGSSPSTNAATSTPTTAGNPANAAIFQFNGAGASTTGPFTSPSAFTLGYKVTCTASLTNPAKFELLREGHVADQVSSSVGSTQESGIDPAFGGAGTFTISVNAPSTCDWTVSGTT